MSNILLPADLLRIQTDFVLPPRISSLLSRYYLLHWDSSYFYQEMIEGEGILSHRNHRYIVIGPEEMSPLKEKQYRESEEMQISFRLISENDDFGYALCSPLLPSPHNNRKS